MNRPLSHHSKQSLQQRETAATKTNASGQRNPFAGDALQELMAQDTKDSICAIYQAIAHSMAMSGFNPPPMQNFLRWAAQCSEHCTRINANALDYAEALLEVRHQLGQHLRTDTEAAQRVFVGCTALEDACGSKAYKELVLEQGKLLQSHIQLPYEAMMNYAFAAMSGFVNATRVDTVFAAWAKVLEQRQRVEAAKHREAQAILDLQAIADGKANKSQIATATDAINTAQLKGTPK